LPQSILAPDIRTSSPHFRNSSAMNAEKSAGEPIRASAPSRPRLACIAGDASALLTAPLSRTTTPAGVPAGATMPLHE
jgi:hypothetical protein